MHVYIQSLSHVLLIKLFLGVVNFFFFFQGDRQRKHWIQRYMRLIIEVLRPTRLFLRLIIPMASLIQLIDKALQVQPKLSWQKRQVFLFFENHGVFP